MPKKVRTARGKELDFDLLKMKQKLANGPAPSEVKQRQDFIDSKLRRRMKKAKAKIDEAKKKRDKGVDVNKTVKVDSTPQGPKIDEVKTASPTKRRIKKKTVK